MSDQIIEVQRREAMGKNVNRRLRLAGLVPAVVYGAGREPLPIQLEKRLLIDLIRGTEGQNPIFLLQLAGTGKSRHAMIRDMQVDPVTRQVIHVDFQRILMTEKLRVSIDIELVGTPEGVKNEGGVLDFVTREVEVECLPEKIPAVLRLDVSGLHVGQHLEAENLSLPEGVTLLDEPQKVIVSVGTGRLAGLEEEEVVEEEEEFLESELTEPEVIKRGKSEEGEDQGD